MVSSSWEGPQCYLALFLFPIELRRDRFRLLCSLWFGFEIGSCYVDQAKPKLRTVFLLSPPVFLVTVGLKISILPSIMVYAYNPSS